MKGYSYFFFSILVLLSFSKGAAQTSFFSNNSIGGQFHYGSFLTNEPKAVYVRDGYSYFGEVYFQQPTQFTTKNNKTGPHWGAGLFFGNTGSEQYIGKMAGAFSFINLPLLHHQAFQSNFRLGAGLGWIEKPYNKVSNHKNVLIGTPINGYLNFLWQNEYAVSNRTFINAGLSFSHLSNGSTTLPNLGLNIPAFSIGFRYGASSLEDKSLIKRDSIINKWGTKAFTSIGIKQKPWIESKRYVVNVFNLELTKRISTRSEFGGGGFLLYDRSLVVDPAVINSVERDVSKTQVGVYGTYSYSVGKLALPLQVGIPIINSKVNPTLFQQIGIRYAVSQKWIGQALLKSYGGKADLIHVGLGYKIF